MGQQLAYLRHNENNFLLKFLKFMVPEAVLNGCDGAGSHIFIAKDSGHTIDDGTS